MMKDMMMYMESLMGMLMSVAYLTLAESKTLAMMQNSKGPNKVGYLGLLQPFADAMKLVVKEAMMPSSSIKFMFMLSPIITFSVALIMWLVMPWKYSMVMFDNNMGMLFMLAMTSFNIYSMLLSGWASNNSYAFLSSMSSMSQFMSYEMSLGFMLLNLFFLTQSLNLHSFLSLQMYSPFMMPLFPLFMLFFMSALAETNRHPFDLVEAESELVAGYLMEYGGMSFAVLYLAEYSNMMFMSMLMNMLFFGTAPSSMMTMMLMFGFMLMSATLPSIKWNDLLILGWKQMLPFTMGFSFLNLSMNLLG